MKELDVVRLKEDYKEISKGTKGTIVLIYDDKNCEVEFFDKEGNERIRCCKIERRLQRNK